MGKFKRLWEWISHGDTAWGVMNLLFPSFGAIGGGIITWLTSLHPAIIFFSILSGITLGLFISNEIAGRRIRKDIGPQPRKAATPREEIEGVPTSDPQERKRADWMTAAIQDDVLNLSGCVIVSEPHICWEHLEEKRGDAYIEFNFDIRSSSVHSLEISKQVEGHVCFGGGELERIPEITQEASKLSHLRRSRTVQLTIRQWLSFTVKVKMQIEYGRQVEFDFSKVNISVMATLPDGSQGSTCRFPIPNVICTQMPNHPNAPVLDT